MGCAQSKTNNENLKMSQSELHEKKGPTHLPSMSGMDSAGTTPTIDKTKGKLDLPSTSTTNGQELSTSSMITQAPLTDNSSQQPSQGTGTNSAENSIEIETEIEIEVEIDDDPVPRNVPKMNHEVPSQSYTAHEIVTPPPSKSVQPQQQRNHFKPPISRQASHSNSKSNSADPIFGAVRRQESRSRAVTDGPNFHPPELQRPASRSDVHPAAGKYQPLAAAQAISVERAEQVSKEKQQELMRKSFANAPPGDTRHHHQHAQVHDSFTPAHKLSTDEVPRTNPRPSISRSMTPGRSLYDPGYHTATSRPIVLDDENRQYDSTKDSYRPPKSSSVPDQPTSISRDADSLKNPRRANKKRASANWATANFVPPPPSSAPPPEHVAMTPASHHHQQYRQSHSEASPYPSGSRTPNTGMQRAGTARTPVMYSSPHHQPLTTTVPQYGPTTRQEMPRSGTYHADPRPTTQQRQMRQHQSYDVPPAPHSTISMHSPPTHPTLATQASYSYSSNPVQYGPGPSPGPGGTRGPVSPTNHQQSSTHHKKKKKKKKRRLGDRGQISEKAFYEKYWIESGVLGEGSFARVRRITRKADQAPFALKLIKKRGMSVDDLTALEKEISILQKLNHPNVVQITDYCDTPKRIYMVVEYCEGGDVFSRIIQQSKFSEKDASHVIRSVTRGLEHCHANGIVHRDLKPDNLMYLTSSADSEIKIIDFGLAGDLVDGPLRTPCGTAHYVAPEVLEGTPYGCEADMWSLGVILYMLLCGFPPFFDQTGNHHRLYKIIKRGEYSFPSPYWNDVSEDAKDLIRNLLVKNPRERLTAQQALRHPWLQGDIVSDQDFSKEYLRQMSHFNSSRHFTERKLGTEEHEPMHSVSLFSAEWQMPQQPPPPPH